jgi:alpha-glucosidase (family GH31 glycosyl hydrolase)
MGKETIRFIGGSPREISTLFLNWQGGWVGIPEWTHGILFWRNENSHTGEIYEDLNKLKTLGYPVSAIWIDNPWETARNTFVIDKNRFPGIEDLLDELKKEGVEIFLWISNHINLPSAETLDRSSLIPVLKEVQREKLYVTNEDGSPLIAPWGSGLGYILNFTNESLLPWLEKKVLPLFSMGFKGWKLDYGEDIVPWVLFPGVSQKARLKEGDPLYAHAIYKRAYHRSFSELTRKYHPDGFLLSRSGGFGEPSLTNCLWPGDIDNNLAFPTLLYDPGEPGEFSTYHPSPYIHSPGGLPTAILATLHLSLSGVPCLATDTGGFRGGTPSPLPFLRWAQFSAYQPVMQIGGAGDHRPWSPVFETPLFPAEEIIRFYAREHLLWYPYLLSYIEKAQEGKDLIVYPALYDHPSAPWIPENHFLYYLGREILVRPIVEEKQPTKVELPSGKWVEFFTGTKEEGRIEKIYPYDRIGLWLKGGTALPRLKEIPEKVNRENLLKGVDLELYFTPLFGGEKWSLKSSYFSVEVNPATDTVTVTVSPPSFLKISLGVSGCVEGGTVEGEDGGQISLPPSGWVSFPRKVKKAVIRCFR